MGLAKQQEMVEGPLLDAVDGKLKLSGWSKEPTRTLNMDHVKPGALTGTPLGWTRFKRGMYYSIMNDELALVFTMTDKSYLAEFDYYEYNFNSQKFRTHKEWFFYGQYPSISDDFSYWRGSYTLQTSKFEVSIQDEDKGDRFERSFKWKMSALELDVDAVFVKDKKLEGAFQTYPLYFDKRYWHKSYNQMNLVVYGEVKMTDKKSFAITAAKDFRGSFTDWCGVYGYKSFMMMSWWQLPPNLADRKGDIHPRISLHTMHGLIHSVNNRVETDIIWDTNESRRMQPILQWPDRQDRMAEWIMQTNKYSYTSEMVWNGFFRPDYRHEDKLDLGLTKHSNTIYFGHTTLSTMTLTRNWKDKDENFNSKVVPGFVMEIYNQW